MSVDPIEAQLDREADGGMYFQADDDGVEYVDSVEATTAWNRMRDDLAASMWANSHAD